MIASLLEGAIVGLGAVVAMVLIIAGLVWILSKGEEGEP